MLDFLPGIAKLKPHMLNRALTCIELCAGRLEVCIKDNNAQFFILKELLKISTEQLKISTEQLETSKEILNQGVVLARTIASCRSDAQKGCAALGVDLRKLVSFGKSVGKHLAIPFDEEVATEASEGGETKESV